MVIPDTIRHYCGKFYRLVFRRSEIESSRASSIEDDFFQLRGEINQTTTNFQPYFKHLTSLECRKKHQLVVVKYRNIDHQVH